MSDRLFRGDCLQVMTTLPPRCVQLIETSPPYNVKYDYADGGASDQLPLPKYLGMLREFLHLGRRLLRPGGVLALNLPPSIRTDDHRAYPLAAWAQMEMQAQGYLMSEPIAWVKSHGDGPVAMTTAMGAPGNPYLRPTYEVVIVGHRETYRIPGKSARREFEGYPEVCKDTWMLPPGKRQKGQALAFPPDLVERLTYLYSAPGDLVLDPFAGTGQVGKVARRLGRTVWLIERQPAYWDALEAVVRQAPLPGIEMGVPV
jgi:adenine-specific DNA-methyltransferase